MHKHASLSCNCSVLQLQSVAVYCSVLQRVAVCCCVLPCVIVCCSVLQGHDSFVSDGDSPHAYEERQFVMQLQCVAVYCSVLQCVAVCCSMLQYVGRDMTHSYQTGTCHVHTRNARLP